MGTPRSGASVPTRTPACGCETNSLMTPGPARSPTRCASSGSSASWSAEVQSLKDAEEAENGDNAAPAGIHPLRRMRGNYYEALVVEPEGIKANDRQRLHQEIIERKLATRRVELRDPTNRAYSVSRRLRGGARDHGGNLLDPYPLRRAAVYRGRWTGQMCWWRKLSRR